MTYTDLIFDLYGTLVDIHTEESAEVWEKTALYFGFYGARCTGAELKRAFEREMAARQAKAGQSYECFPDIPFEQVMDALFRKRASAPRDWGRMRRSCSALRPWNICGSTLMFWKRWLRCCAGCDPIKPKPDCWQNADSRVSLI